MSSAAVSISAQGGGQERGIHEISKEEHTATTLLGFTCMDSFSTSTESTCLIQGIAKRKAPPHSPPPPGNADMKNYGEKNNNDKIRQNKMVQKFC